MCAVTILFLTGMKNQFDFFVLLSSVRIIYKTIVLRACVKLMEINKNPL